MIKPSSKVGFQCVYKSIITSACDLCNVGKWSILPGHRSAGKKCELPLKMHEVSPQVA